MPNFVRLLLPTGRTASIRVLCALIGVVTSVSLVSLENRVLGQSGSETKIQVSADELQSKKVGEVNSAAQRRSFALSLVTSLADEARSYQNLASRARILARAADTIWQTDKLAGLSLFRRAWEAAENADAEKQAGTSNRKLPAMAIALQRTSGRDLRGEVLSLAARRDRALGEEFLAKLVEANKSEAPDVNRDLSSENTNDGWSGSEASIKRLLLASRLLDEGEIERALEFATPALDRVNARSIQFLAVLRTKRPQIADQLFSRFLSQVELDPRSDANTVSGLSSYAFTPNLYVTFSPDGGIRWSQPEEVDHRLIAPVLPAELLQKFFRTASRVLLRPLQPPEKDVTSSGRMGKAMVVRRLLPLFEQYDPQSAIALRAQQAILTSELPPNAIKEDHSLLTRDLQLFKPADELLVRMQETLDRAKTSRDRDAIYSDTAAKLATQGDIRALELISKIEEANVRLETGRYVAMQLIHFAIRKKQPADVLELAKTEQLTRAQRTWAYTAAARLTIESDIQQALQILEEAANEARRIETTDPDRPRALIAVSTQLASADNVRAWEIMAEAVKAANAAPEFSGANTPLRYALVTTNGLNLGSIGGAEFGLSGVFKLLAKDDLYRSLDLAKSFKADVPRATAILAIASQILQQYDVHHAASTETNNP